MNVPTGEGKLQSLGQLVAGLEPGDECPWCGAVLKRHHSIPVGVRHADARLSRVSDEPVLRCSGCGSEVCEAGDGEAITARIRLGAAA